MALIVTGAATGVASVWHARRAVAPMLDLQALGVRTFALATASAGFVSRSLSMHRHSSCR
jgi:hypothetical protein